MNTTSVVSEHGSIPVQTSTSFPDHHLSLPPPSTSALKRKKSGNSRFSKKPRLGQSDSRRGGVGHLKLPPTSALIARAIRKVFPVYTGLGGLERLCEITYNVLKAKDHRLDLSLEGFKYATCLCVYAKIALAAEANGTAFPVSLSALKQVTKGIYLPDYIARYVETFGLVEVRTGLLVLPLYDEPKVMYKWPGGTNPIAYLADGAEVRTEWNICNDVLLAYGDASGRAQRSGLNFRKVDFDAAGSVEMLVSYTEKDDEERTLLTTPFSTEAFSSDVMHLGACYRFRERGATWPGDHSWLLRPCFTSTSVEAVHEIKSRVLDGFM